jgi:DNA (cytosine-5)-methyltransferase 1
MHDQQAIVTSGNAQRKYIVRRLTPIECARLQGFPDWWCEGFGGSDSAIYKTYGNGLALPCAYDVLRRIADATNKATLL